MSFTDEDLKRFKRAFIDKTRLDSYSEEGCEKHLAALITRLEAAEKVAERFSNLLVIAVEAEEIIRLSKIEADYRWQKVLVAKEDVNAWRKAAGK